MTVGKLFIAAEQTILLATDGSRIYNYRVACSIFSEPEVSREVCTRRTVVLKASYKPGDVVKVCVGLLDGKKGTVMRITPENRVTVNVKGDNGCVVRTFAPASLIAVPGPKPCPEC